MGLFNKNKKDVKEDVPKLPELPKLPDLPDFEDGNSLPRLPAFPKSSFGEKFSQNTIKDAIAGEKEDDKDFEADEFADNREQRMQKPFKTGFMTKEMENESDEYGQFQNFERKILRAPSFPDSRNPTKRTEPIFVRLDKFEESLKVFEKTRNQISDMQNMLSEIKKLKEQEERELQFWEQEMQNVKKQMEKISSEIFSRVE